MQKMNGISKNTIITPFQDITENKNREKTKIFQVRIFSGGLSLRNGLIRYHQSIIKD